MPQFFKDLLPTLIRLALIVSGVVMAAIVLMVAVVLGAGVLGWSLLTGRRPQFRFERMNPRATMAGMRARAQAHAPRRAPPATEVIDIEAREVKD